ncbi:unnamed protein product [Larinioides sclopetarius]|uniref:Uncharacterized protein n=1 Tax=Larinioides sclopetarius TaxID=280406 RepID=A0AAV2B2K0_9ARAC
MKWSQNYQSLPRETSLDHFSTSVKLFSRQNAFWQKAFSRQTPNRDSAIQLVEIEPLFLAPENVFPFIYGLILTCLAQPQPSSAVGLCNQIIMGGGKIETKQMHFLADGIYRKNSSGCLLELLEYVDHGLEAVFPNFFRQHSSVSIS